MLKALPWMGKNACILVLLGKNDCILVLLDKNACILALLLTTKTLPNIYLLGCPKDSKPLEWKTAI
jgi:hypothetical protein